MKGGTSPGRLSLILKSIILRVNGAEFADAVSWSPLTARPDISALF